MVCFRLIFNVFYHISEVEINITQKRGTVDNCYIKWSNTVNWLQVEYKIITPTVVNFHFHYFPFFCTDKY